MTPSLKILTASETPIVTVGDDGSLTIATGSCGDTGSPVAEMTSPPVMAPVMEVPDATSPPVAAPVEEAPVEVPTEAEEPTGEEAPTASGVGRLATGFLGLLFPSRASIFCSCLLLALGELQSVVADGHLSCTPTLTVEISMPVSATATETFGETDHYLAATVETVTWGYFDPNATTQMSMESGETVTVEVITHHSGHDYAKMIRGDPAVEEIFYFESNMTLTDKPEPKLPGSGVHLITGPIEVVGAMPGDVLQVDILELDPRPNPVTGKTFGTNSQKFAGYQYRGSGTKRDGTPYVRTGGTEAITVIEFIEDEAGNMLYGKPVYMYRFPNMTGPDGSMRTFDNNPAFMVPHEFDHGYNGELLDDAPIAYPPGFDDTVVTDEGGIVYLSPDMAMLNWKAPLRPHLGTLAVMPNNTANYIDESAPGGANTIPPARFGGNIDDWRIGKGGTMYYVVEVPGAQVVVGDTHAAQGDSELAGTAMETSMTTKLRMTLHKKEDGLPKIVETLDFPLLETKDKWIVHGFAFANYLDDLEDASTIFAEGASIDLAMQDCFVRTRNWLMDVFDLIEEETIAISKYHLGLLRSYTQLLSQ